MKVIVGDIWDYMGKGWVVIPTNLVVTRSDKKAAMTSGLAQQACSRFPGLDRLYGQFLYMCDGPPQLFTFFASGLPIYGGLILFPTKEYRTEKARPDFIEAGLRSLIRLPITNTIFLPFIGTGFGSLDPEPMRALLEQYLTTDRFVLVERALGLEQKYPDAFRVGRAAQQTAYYDRSLVNEKARN